MAKEPTNQGKIVQNLADGLAKKKGYKSANDIPCERPVQCQFPKLCRACSLKAEFYQEARRRVKADADKRGLRLH